MKDVALITLHGMGKVEPNYHAGLEKKLKDKLGIKWANVSFQPVQYAPILQAPEEQLWAAMQENPKNKLNSVTLRQFILYGFGDAGSLEHSVQTDKKQYIAIQREIQNSLERALVDFDGDTGKPIVFIAQSLGCHVISSYLWDAEYGKNIFAEVSVDAPEKINFLKLKSLTNLVTTGCNIPVIIGGLKDRSCFSKPAPVFVWDNYYDPDDVLGWPLQQLGPTFDIVRDHAINSGGGLAFWNAASHLGYWTDDDVVSPLADILKSKIN